MMNLTPRLATVASFIPHGTSFADIGTDHGYVPVYMGEQGFSPRIIAADIGKGPLLAAQHHVAGAGLTKTIECRLGDGLTCLRPGEVDGAVICGMGGPLMVRILEMAPNVWEQFSYLVLQPMSDTGAIRRFLYTAEWHIDQEALVVDDSRLYEIMRAVPGRVTGIPDWQYEIGPINWEQKEPLLCNKIEKIIDKKSHILQGLQKSQKDMTKAQEALQQEITEWRDRLWQLQSVK